jgi:hypothetical protein
MGEGGVNWLITATFTIPTIPSNAMSRYVPASPHPFTDLHSLNPPHPEDLALLHILPQAAMMFPRHDHEADLHHDGDEEGGVPVYRIGQVVSS